MLDLPRLTLSPPVACPICDRRAPRAIGKRDFGDSCNDVFAGSRTFPHYGIEVPYYRCEACAFTLTNALDGWTADDYRGFIYNDEYEKADPPFHIERPLRNAQIVAGIWHYDKATLTVLDYGGGGGAFAAELMKLGFTCETCDAFYGEPPKAKLYSLITCFEVIEHVPHFQQIACFEDITAHIEPDGLILLSTKLLLPETSVEDDYISPRNGHISVHSEESLRRMAARFNLEVMSLNSQTHLLRRARIR